MRFFIAVAMLAVGNTLLSPLVPFIISSESYLDGVAQQALVSVVIAAFVLFVWLVLRPLALHVFHIGRDGPMPWYASPVVLLLGPMLFAMYMMFF